MFWAIFEACITVTQHLCILKSSYFVYLYAFTRYRPQKNCKTKKNVDFAQPMPVPGTAVYYCLCLRYAPALAREEYFPFGSSVFESATGAATHTHTVEKHEGADEGVLTRANKGVGAVWLARSGLRVLAGETNRPGRTIDGRGTAASPGVAGRRGASRRRPRSGAAQSLKRRGTPGRGGLAEVSRLGMNDSAASLLGVFRPLSRRRDATRRRAAPLPRISRSEGRSLWLSLRHGLLAQSGFRCAAWPQPRSVVCEHALLAVVVVAGLSINGDALVKPRERLLPVCCALERKTEAEREGGCAVLLPCRKQVQSTKLIVQILVINSCSVIYRRLS